MPILSFKDRGTSNIAAEIRSKLARRKLPESLHGSAYRKLVFLGNAQSLVDLSNWNSLHLEKMKGDRRDFYSIRINDQYRICFRWNGADALGVEIVDYH